jgi:UDP-N-acetylglucosamine 2-epimerase (non-hydrolysing)
MIDTLVRLLPDAETRWEALRARLGISKYVLATLHRPSNVDALPVLAAIVDALNVIGRQVPVIFPVHPRTRTRLESARIPVDTKAVCLTEPFGYVDFLALEAHAQVVLTDSGGVQEETTYLGIPCITLRPNTERPVTITVGTNRLVPPEAGAISAAIADALASGRRLKRRPELWDGHTADRIVDVFTGMACSAA